MAAEQSGFDVVIVGGGPGGYPAAIRAAQYGLRVALIEKERPGGVCLNWGCIPTKAMLRSADVLKTLQHSADYGILADNVRLDYPAVLKRKDAIVKGLNDGVSQLLKANGVTVFNGHARVTSRDTLEVVGVGKSPLGANGPLYNAPADARGQPQATVSGKHIIIATGSTPAQL
ncbi:MAG TPA: FAD-dependent oxidoreductase, partial [Chloroflexota bacterium]